MKDDRVLGRLRAARPAVAEPGHHDALFARIVAEPGDPRVLGAPGERSWTRPRSRVLAGGTLGLAAVVAGMWVARRLPRHQDHPDQPDHSDRPPA